MAAQGEPPLINPDAEELVFKPRLNSIPCRGHNFVNADYCGNGVCVEYSRHMYFLFCISSLQTVLYFTVTRLVITYSTYSILYGYKCSYKTGYYIFHVFYTVWLQVQLLDWLLVWFTV